MSHQNIIGKRIQLARKQANPRITQTELASRMQLKGFPYERITICKIENGYRQITDKEILALAESLGLSIEWFFKEVTLDDLNTD